MKQLQNETKMKAGQTKTIANGNKTKVVYITKTVSPWGDENYTVNAYTKLQCGGKSYHRAYSTEQEAQAFAEDYIQ